MAQPKTKRPTGVTIARSNSSFVTKWKITDENYGDGQTFQWWNRLTGKYETVTIGKTTTQKTITLTAANYYPTTNKKLTSFTVRIRGNRSKYTVEDKNHNKTVYEPTVSDWTKKTITIKAPGKPSLTSTLSGQYSNVTTFSWAVENNTTSNVWLRDVEYQTILVKESNETDGSKLSWKSSTLGWHTGTGGATGSVPVAYTTEDTTLLASASYTRWVRVRARGVAGVSEWRYAKHVYARPYQAQIKSASVKPRSSGGYMCSVTWSAGSNASHPIDIVTVQYAFAVPLTGMVCPDNASWQNADVIKDTSGTDASSFSVGTAVDVDQCMFVRVNTQHDSNVTAGNAAMVIAGYLEDPDDLSFSMDQSTRRASVTATNNSQNPDSYLAIVYKTSNNANGFIIGIIPHGQTTATVQAPAAVSGQAEAFGVYAVVGAATATTRADGVSSYAIRQVIRSHATVYEGGDIPQAPENVSLSMTEIPGTIRVTFDWAWRAATSAELSWADHADAWESTAGPTTYVLDNTHASAWNISGLATGKTWFVRVRLSSGSGDGKAYGAYSDIMSIDLTSAPAIPVLTLSSGVITEHGEVTASWGFSSGDGTGQAYAEVAEVIVVNGSNVYTPIAHAQTAMHVTIKAEEIGWTSGETHALVVRVVSGSGRASDGWSDPVNVSIADPITSTITQTSLANVTVEEDETERTIYALLAMPLTITVTGAGAGGTTSVVIERSEPYHIGRPDETEFNGYEGETIALVTQVGEGQITIDSNDLVGSFDDEAQYRIIATVQDGLGQSAEATLDFEVHWTHQAVMPEAEAYIIKRHMVAVITPKATNPAQGDVCDIYRLSVDRPELIYPNASFGTAYVDPYPAIGEFGGHRVVYKTANGDYITAENKLAWIDLKEPEGDLIESDYSIIDFGSGRLLINRNLDISNSWSKDFQETKYLGGSVQGDWNPAVSRQASVTTVAVSIIDQETIQMMRRLAVYAGICHVRTSDGSSYAANVDVSDDYSHSTGRKVITYKLTINRVDPEDFDGMTYADWLSANMPPGEQPIVGMAEAGYAILTA